MDPQQGRSYEFMLFVSLQPVFLRLCSLFFSKILHSFRNRETKKWEKWSFQKNSWLPWNRPKRPRMTQEFSILVVTLCWKPPKKEFLIFSFTGKLHIWENSASKVKNKNAVVQCDYRILWSSIFVDGMHRYLWFLHKGIHKGKVACEAITLGCVCLDITSDPETCQKNQYLWLSISLETKQSVSLGFFHRDKYQRKILYKSTTTGWVWLGMPSHAQTYLD